MKGMMLLLCILRQFGRGYLQGSFLMTQCYAHSYGGNTGDWQPLRDHLLNVACLTRRFAEEARPGDAGFAQAAYAAGLLHDLGKYRPGFQNRLHNSALRGESTWHSQAGAVEAAIPARRWADVAFAILGHHGGIPDGSAIPEQVAGGRAALAECQAMAEADLPELRQLPTGDNGLSGANGYQELRTRLLFSCLVDADWLDTSAFYSRVGGFPLEPMPVTLDPGLRLQRLLAYATTLSQNCPEREMANIRREILDAALCNAQHSPGIFTLTVPTGGGKTLAALAFALAHAARHGLRRVIYVAPYLSILEQNASVFRRALGEGPDGGLVFEHHSLTKPEPACGDEAEAGHADRLAENWDAPIIVTTSVQIFESLFSNMPSRCRKLHNIARSVVILDECQTLPTGLSLPTCQMLQEVNSYLGCTIVLSTATQPAWQRDDERLPSGFASIREIAPSPSQLFERLRRVHVHWPQSGTPSLGWSEVAHRMADQRQVLCIVNTRSAASEIFLHLHRGGFPAWHLSTSMCPAHRMLVLAEIQRALVDGLECRVVATQLVEAGVDIDFPLVMREMAPLDSIIQAAGRCNRERRLNKGDLPGGEVQVFQSVDGNLPPDSWYRSGTAIVANEFIKQGRLPCIDNPHDIAEYYRRLMSGGNLDQKDICSMRRRFYFAEVAANYRIIDENTTSVVVAKWAPAADQISQLLRAVQHQHSRSAYRQLQRYSVNLYQHDWQVASQCCRLPEETPGLNVCDLPYDENLGLRIDGTSLTTVF